MADRVIFIEQSGTAPERAKGPLDDARLQESVREAMKAPDQSRRGKTLHLKDFPDQVFLIARVMEGRVIASWKEPVGADPADIESGENAIVVLAHQEPLRPFDLAPTEKTPMPLIEPEDVDPESRCDAIVESLQHRDLTHEERRSLILESEVLPFRGRQAAALTPLLKRFIEEYRESNVPADLVAVGSAIRNYVARATIGEAFEAAASLLKSQGRLPIPLELEVEVTKMVVRKLTANPPVQRDQYPEMALRLEELVDAYAKPRFLAREKYGAIALNALLGLVLSRSGRDADVVERMRTLDVPWFQELLARRAARLRTDLVARDSEAKIVDIADVLEQLSALDSPSLTP